MKGQSQEAQAEIIIQHKRGMSVNDIANHLCDKRIPTCRGKRYWNVGTVWRVIKAAKEKGIIQ